MTAKSITVLQTKPHKSTYRSARAEGHDWRDIGAALIRSLDLQDADKPHYSCAFLFITDALAGDAASLLTLLQDVTAIPVWAGCSGIGVMDSHGASLTEKAAVLLVCDFPPHCVMNLPIQTQPDFLILPDTIHSWLKLHGPPFGLVFADPFPDGQLGGLLHQLSRQTGAFLVGGISSAADDADAAGHMAGILLSSQVYVQTAMSQGCTPIGPAHTITRLDNGLIAALDDQPALHVFASDLRHMAMADIGTDPDAIAVGHEVSQEALEDSFSHLFQGEVHVGLPIAGSDRGDYLVRPMLGVEADSEHIMIDAPLQEGMAIRFVRRNDKTMFGDLARMLDDVKKRVEDAPNPPKAAIYISCAGRAVSPDMRADELVSLRAVLGDIPMAGFYAGGEIFREDQHSFTGILTLFY